MKIKQAQIEDAPKVASVLREAAQWLADAGVPLWAVTAFTDDRVLPDVVSGLYFVAHAEGGVAGDAAGVMKFELDDAYFWPEIASGTSAFVHKLAVRRTWAGKGVSASLLTYASERAASLGCQHLRLDCVAGRSNLRQMYERFGFRLHSVVERGGESFARYALAIETLSLRAGAT